MVANDSFQVDIEQAIQDYGGMVRRLAWANETSMQDAEDIFQEVFLKLYRYQEHIESEEHLKAWLIRVTVNECHSQARTAYKRHEIPAEDVILLDQAVDSFEEKLKKDEIYRKVKSLPKNYREVILLYYYEGLSIKEIAELLQIKENTVKTRLLRARTRLAVLLVIIILLIAVAILLGRYYRQSLRSVSMDEIRQVYDSEELAEMIRILLPVVENGKVVVELPEGSDDLIAQAWITEWKCVDEGRGQFVQFLDSSDTEIYTEDMGKSGTRWIMSAKQPERKFLITDSAGHVSECSAEQVELGEDYAVYSITLNLEYQKDDIWQRDWVDVRVRTDLNYENVELLGIYQEIIEDGEVHTAEEPYSIPEGSSIYPFAFMREIKYDEAGYVLPFDEWEGSSTTYTGFTLSGELKVKPVPIKETEDVRYIFYFFDDDGNSYWTDISGSL